ncbi:MAG TPA: glucosyl-3-phosphoglycerate synthase [Solirubrobacteraceae bacterium]|nr:glucosyl-3-phosphoglycerate synthase [Solirubrobacteraceae bacterium]
MGRLAAVVVVPARDEAERIASCLRALSRQTLSRDRFAVIVVLDRCRDATAEVARATAAETGLDLALLTGPGVGVGAARRLGMDAAYDRLLRAHSDRGLIACTDADSRPARDWLERQLAHVAAGAEAIAGLIELDGVERAQLPEAVLRARRRDAQARLGQVRAADPGAEHHHAAGASLAVTVETYRRVGGIEPLQALEDSAFADRLAEHRVALLRPADVRVRTSARAEGRAPRGLSVDLAVSRWLHERRYRASDFTLERLLSLRGRTRVSVIVPARECAETIGGVLTRTVAPMLDAGLVEEVVVVDAASRDGTAEVARRHGARVLQQDRLRRDLGPALGKGDAMWRALPQTRGEVVCFLDADTADPHPHHLLGLLGPILTEPSIVLVKGAFARPLRAEGVTLPDEGGRVTELMARPLLNLHEPRLAGFRQPLAGEVAARRELLEAVSFPAGYGVEIALLIDALRRHGLDALAECDLGSRQNRHQPLRALGEMAYAVLAAMERRVAGSPARSEPGRYLRPWDGSLVPVPVVERPPIASAGRSNRGRRPPLRQAA